MHFLLKGKSRALGTIVVVFASALLVGCGSGDSSTPAPLGPHANLRDMAALADDSFSIVRQSVPDAVLRQVDYYSEGYVFRFTDAASTKGITVHAIAGMSPEQWKVVDEISPLLGHPTPGLDLAMLTVGPESILDLARNHWSDGDLRSIGLTGDGRDLTWNVFWNLPEGVVSGWVDGVTGEFTASSAPPAMVPSIATARPG